MQLDHIVYGVPNLSQAIKEFQEKTGVTPTIGGKHKGLGTHNAIVSLGNLRYIELIALDPDASIKNRALPSWCAPLLDITKPEIMTWAIQTDNMTQLITQLNSFNLQIDPPQLFSREKPDSTTISMELAFKKQPPAPYDGIIPFLINWKSIHPTKTMESRCQIKNWYGTHPKADEINAIFSKVGIVFVVKKAPSVSMHLVLNTPKGIIEI